MEIRDKNDELFIRLCSEIIRKGEKIEKFADKEGKITLVEDKNGDLFWIINGKVGELYNGRFDYNKTDSFMIGRHSETLKCTCLNRNIIKNLKGKSTIEEFTTELTELYNEFGKGELKVRERKRERGMLLSYYREIKYAEKSLHKQDGEDVFEHAARIANQPESYLIRQYFDILTNGIEILKEIAVFALLTNNEREKKIYELTIDRIVDETLKRIQ